MKRGRIRTELIKIFIKTQPISKEELCAKCKVSIKEFEKVMQNNLSVRISTIYKLAKYMHLELCQMFD